MTITAKRNSVKLSDAALALVQGAQWTKPGAVWDMDEPLATIPAGDYEAEMKRVAGTNGGKDWDCWEAFFFAEGIEKPLVMRYRAGVTPNKDGDLVIASFTALRNWPTDVNPKIKKRQPGIFAVNG